MSAQEKERAILRRKYPAKARKADHQNGRPSGAIQLFCRECVGSRAGVRDCAVLTCFLWPYRGVGDNQRPAGAVPTCGEYDEMTEGMGNAEALPRRGEPSDAGNP